jgi:hypothetical protein
LFDGDWYLRENEDVARSGINPLVHYLRQGAKEGRDPHPLFDTGWYLETNPEIRGTAVNPLQHFLEVGGPAGRSPHRLFDSSFYLESNPEIRDFGVSPLIHYLRQGWREGRNPNPLFDGDWYLRENEDVARSGTNPLVHYLRQGAKEGRDPHPLFDTRWYLKTSPEIRGTAANPLRHFLEIGGPAGRSPHRLFDSLFYLENNPEIRVGGANPLLHYLESGATEGRSPNNWFDNKGYIARYPDVRESGLNPLVHYRLHGAVQGRDASRESSPPPDEQDPKQSKPNEMWSVFRSLGESCEFGFVQRHYGSEIPSLFRFALTSLGGLTSALRSGFHNLAALECLSIETEYLDDGKACGAFHVWSHDYGLRFHAGYNHILDLEKLKNAESRRLEFLLNTFIEDLQTGEKIFVFKSVPELAGFVTEQAHVDKLVAAMRAHGPTTLLWVTVATDDHPPGSVEDVSDGLIRGYIDHLAPREGILAGLPPAYVISYSVEAWEAVCAGAYALWLRKRDAVSKGRGGQSFALDAIAGDRQHGNDESQRVSTTGASSVAA